MPATQIDVGIVLKAVDKASAELAKAQESLKQFGGAAKQEADEVKKAAEAAVESAQRHKEAAKEAFLMGEAFKEVGRGAQQLGGQFKGATAQWNESMGTVTNKIDQMTGGYGKWLGVAMMGFGTITQVYSGYQKLSMIMETMALTKAKNTAATLAETGATATGTTGVFASIGAHISAAGAKVGHTITNWAHAASQWAVNVAMYACPIVWIIALIVGLIAVIVLLVQNWDKVAKAFGDFGKWAGKGLGDAWAGITKWCGDVGKAMGQAWDGIKNGAAAAWDWISNGFKGIAEKAVEWGKAVVRAFNDGMQAAKKWLEDGCKNIGDSIAKFFKGASPPKEGPLSNIDKWGENLTMTLGQGITRGIPRVESLINSAGTSITNNRNNQVSAEINISGVDEERIARRVIDLLSEAMG